MAINSHYFQKALLKKVMKTKQVFHHTYGDNKIRTLNVANTGSKKELFSGGEEFISELEKRMNESFENLIFNKVINKDIAEHIILTYEESILLRKYMLVTFLRANLNDSKDKNIQNLLTKVIHNHTNKEYESRFTNFDEPVANYFMHGSSIKFIKHKDLPVIWPSNYFYPVPFDVACTDMEAIRLTTNDYPGYVFRISENHSIMVLNHGLVKLARDMAIKHLLQKDKQNSELIRPFRIKTSEPEKWLVNNNEIIHPDGTTSKAEEFYTTPEEVKKHREEVLSRDKKEFKYKYNVINMLDNDYTLLVLNSLNHFIHVANVWKLDVVLYFSNKKLVKELFSSWLNIEKFVSYSYPENIEYWSLDGNKKGKHAIWEEMNDHSIEYFKQVIKAIDGS